MEEVLVERFYLAMRHKFRVFDVGPDGTHYDAGKIIACELIENDSRDCVNELLRSMGFNNFLNYYYPYVSTNNKDIEIKYQYNDGSGMKTTWFLKRGV